MLRASAFHTHRCAASNHQTYRSPSESPTCTSRFSSSASSPVRLLPYLHRSRSRAATLSLLPHAKPVPRPAVQSATTNLLSIAPLMRGTSCTKRARLREAVTTHTRECLPLPLPALFLLSSSSYSLALTPLARCSRLADARTDTTTTKAFPSPSRVPIKSFTFSPTFKHTTADRQAQIV